jgi:WD40 repeat protein
MKSADSATVAGGAGPEYLVARFVHTPGGVPPNDLEVVDAIFAPGGSQILSAGKGGAKLWQIAPPRSIRTFPMTFAVSLAFSADNTKVAAGSGTEDNVARVWTVDGQLIANLQHGAAVLSICFNRSGTRLLTACFGDSFARVWDISTQQVVAEHQHSDQWVTCAKFDSLERNVLSGSSNDTAALWDSLTGNLVRVLGADGSGFGVNDVAFDPGGNRAAIFGSNTGQAATFDLGTGRLIGSFRLGDTSQVAGTYAGGGTLLFTGNIGDAVLWSIANGTARARYAETWVRNAEVSRSGEVVLVGALDHGSLCDVQGNLMRTFKHGAEIARARFSPDNSRVVTAGRDGTVGVWDAVL